MRILTLLFSCILILTSCGTNEELSKLKAENARLIQLAEQAALEAKTAQEQALQMAQSAQELAEQQRMLAEKATEAALQQKILADKMRIELEELKKRCK